MVHTDAENYEGIYFLTDEEVLDAAARYRRWWEGSLCLILVFIDEVNHLLFASSVL